MKRNIMAKRLVFLSYILAVIFALLLVSFGLKNVYSEESSDSVACNAVSICSGLDENNKAVNGYTISCSSVPDGYCPYDFAEWNNLDGNGKTCKTFLHNAGTENEFTDFCEVCDPDCAKNKGRQCFSLSSFNFREIEVSTGR